MDEENKEIEEGVGASEPSGAAAATDELAVARAEAATNLEGWRRAMADYANLKRDGEMRMKEMGRYASAGVVSALLPVLDTFGKAFVARPAEDADVASWKKWAEGIGHVKSQFEKAMENAGVMPIDAVDVPFDPTMHEAVMQKAVEGKASGTVITVLESGWKIYDRVLRPAKVEVAE
jgi:molecular chaperone GrpE